ncbi:MAG TPA: sigma-70 family RNA polymerase sigma factor [Solirubrobacterales bacterium]
MYGVKASDELKQEELEEARLGFIQFLRRKRFSPQFIESHGDDLFATAALEYSRKLAEGEQIDSPSGWLITCAWRRTKSQLEAEGRRPHLVSVDSGAQVADETSRDPEEAVLDEDRFRKIREAVDQLSVDQRRLLALSYFEGLTVREAGRALQWHASKAQRAHEGARRKLHDLLGVTSSDDLAVEIGLAAYVSLTAGATTGNLLERVARKSTETLASFKQQVADTGAQLKQHATATYYRAVDPTPLAAARPGTVGAVLASCLAIGGGAATYCVEQGVNPVGAARSLLASTDEPEEQTPSEAEPEPSPGPVYTPVEPTETEEAPAPEPTPTAEQEPEPKPKPEPPKPEDSFEPSSSAYASSEAGSEETYEAPEAAPVESTQSAPAPARPGPQFGGP